MVLEVTKVPWESELAGMWDRVSVKERRLEVLRDKNLR